MKHDVDREGPPHGGPSLISGGGLPRIRLLGGSVNGPAMYPSGTFLCGAKIQTLQGRAISDSEVPALPFTGRGVTTPRPALGPTALRCCTKSPSCTGFAPKLPLTD